MLINSFKITCILRSSVDRYRDQLLRRWSAFRTHLFILTYIIFGVYNCTEHTCIKIIYLMQWMMLFAYLHLLCCDTLHNVLRPRTFPPFLVLGCDKFRRSWVARVYKPTWTLINYILVNYYRNSLGDTKHYSSYKESRKSQFIHESIPTFYLQVCILHNKDNLFIQKVFHYITRELVVSNHVRHMDLLVPKGMSPSLTIVSWTKSANLCIDLYGFDEPAPKL